MLTFHLFHLTSFPSRLIVASPRHQSSTKQAVHGCRKRAATCHEPTCSRAMEPSDGASPCHYLWQLHHHGARGGVSGWVRRVLSGGAAFFLFAWGHCGCRAAICCTGSKVQTQVGAVMSVGLTPPCPPQLCAMGQSHAPDVPCSAREAVTNGVPEHPASPPRSASGGKHNWCMQ